MSDGITIQLNEHWSKFVAEMVVNGRFESTTDAVGAALRLLQYEERKFDRLAELLAEGEASGPAEPWDFEDFLREQGLFDEQREAA